MMSDSEKQSQSDEQQEIVWDQKALKRFLKGKITLAELQGFSQETQYKLAELGFNMIGGGKLDEAEKIFRGLVALNPKDPYFLLANGSICQRKNELQEAEKWYSEALKQSPDHAVALANRGEVRLELGQLQEGAEDLIESLKQDPKLEQATSQRARALLVGLKETLDEAAQNAADKPKSKNKTKAKKAKVKSDK